MTTGIMKKENAGASMPATSFSGLVDRIFQNNLNRFFEDGLWGPVSTQRNFVPVNVRENDKDYELELVAPGLSKDDFRIHLEGELLTVSFEHKEDDQQKNHNWIRNEYRMQSFTRSFTMDESVDANKIVAKYENGILRLLLPKKEGAQRISKTIEIK